MSCLLLQQPADNHARVTTWSDAPSQSFHVGHLAMRQGTTQGTRQLAAVQCLHSQASGPDGRDYNCYESPNTALARTTSDGRLVAMRDGTTGLG